MRLSLCASPCLRWVMRTAYRIACQIAAALSCAEICSDPGRCVDGSDDDRCHALSRGGDRSAVTILGSEGGLTIDAQEIARQAGTISYSVLCGIALE